MISGFLTSVISSPWPRQHIEERLTLIIDFTIFTPAFLAAKRFDKWTNRVSTGGPINTPFMREIAT